MPPPIGVTSIIQPSVGKDRRGLVCSQRSARIRTRFGEAFVVQLSSLVISINKKELSMSLIRTAEAKILPGKRQQWGELTKEINTIVGRHGVSPRYAQLVYGGLPNTVISTSFAEDWETLAARSDAIGADAEFQALMSRIGADPASEAIQVGVLEDITTQVGGEPLAPGGESIFQSLAMQVLPGKQAKLLNFIGQMREARAGAGRPSSNVLRVAIGDVNTILIVRAYADSAAWAADQAAGQPDSANAVLEKAQADADFPYSEVIGSRVMRDITDSI